MSTDTIETPPTHLSILQYNVARSQTTKDCILNHPDLAKHHLIMLHEHYWSDYKKATLSHHSWTIIEPQHPEIPSDTRTRAAIYLNNTKISSNAYASIPFSSPDVVAIQLMDAESHATLVVNIYNDPSKDTIMKLGEFLAQQCWSNNYIYMGLLVAGDFNLHHPLWNKDGYHIHNAVADKLLQIMGAHSMDTILPPRTITFPRANKAIDLVWGNNFVQQHVIKCKITKNEDHGSDHLPIWMLLHLTPSQPETTIQQAFNYEKADWDELWNQIQ